MSDEYWSLSEEKFEELKVLGRTAKELRSSGMAAFPVHSRRQHRNRGRGEWAGEDVLPPRWLPSSNERSVMVGSIVSGEAVQLPHPDEDKPVLFDTQWKILEDAFAKDIVKVRRENEAKLKGHYREIIDAKLQDRVLQNRQRLRGVTSANWVGFPHTCPAVAGLFDPIAVLPAQWGGRHKEWEPATTLAQAWRERHQSVKDTPAAHTDPGVVRKPCYEAHYCHCHGRGRIIKLLHTRLRRYMLQQCQDPAVQSSLTSGHVVIYWRCKTISERSVANDGASSSDQLPCGGVTHHFTHVALMYLRPWRPTLVVMNPVQVAELERIPDAESQLTAEHLSHRHHLQAASTEGALRVTSVWQWLHSLNLAQRAP